MCSGDYATKHAKRKGSPWNVILSTTRRGLDFPVRVGYIRRLKAMTQDIPKLDSQQIRCAECDQPVTLRRKPNKLLYVSCDCADRISARVGSAIPEGWSV